MDNKMRHAFCNLCDNEEKGTEEELLGKGWFLGMMGETCPDDHYEEKSLAKPQDIVSNSM